MLFRKKRTLIFCLAGLLLYLCGCSVNTDERLKLRDLDFTILSEELIPTELKTIIDERKAESFQLTYSDKENLYIVVGYGQQETGGYSIAVNELYLTENAVYVNTSLLGPETVQKNTPSPSWPYIVIKTELTQQTVVFE